MLRKPDSDIPKGSEAHVPWESIDEEEEEPGDQGESDSNADASDADADSDTAPEISSVDEEAPGPRISSPVPSTGGGWTFPLLCAGVALISCCALIPQADANRRLAYEKQELQRDL